VELLAALVSVITLAFFVTVIAVVAIVFGQQRVLDQAIQVLGGTLKSALKIKVKQAYDKAREASETVSSPVSPRQAAASLHAKRRIERFPAGIPALAMGASLEQRDC